MALATNSPGARGVAVGAAINADVASIDAQDDDGWLQLAPYGETVYLQPEGSTVKQYKQVFQRDQAQKMASAFNAAAMKRGRNFRGLPVYVGHPDADPGRWPDDRRIGAVKALEARAEGLFVQVVWNDLGEKNRAEGYHPFPSPAWLHNQRDAARTGRIVPDELQSVGLVNNPRIPDVHAWTNANPTPEEFSDTTAENMIKKLLAKILGIAEDATEEQFQTAYNSHFTGDVTAVSLKTTATNAETARTTAETTLGQVRTELAIERSNVTTANTVRDAAIGNADKFRKLAVNSLLDAATNAGRLTAAERPAFEQQFTTDFDAAAAALAAKTVVLNANPLNLPRLSGADLATSHGRSIAFNAEIDKHMAKNLTFDQALNAMRQEPEGKAILKAMDDAKPKTA